MPIGQGRIGGFGVKATPGIKGPHRGVPWRSPALSRLTPSGGTALSPTFSVDWTTTSSIPSQLSLSRSSSGTYFDSSGVLQTATSNTARFDNTYNGSVWSAAGLLVEEQRTNLILQSASMTTSWTNDGTSTTTSATTSPDGGTNASKIVESTSGGEHRIYQSASITASSSTVYRFFAKKAERNWVAIRDSGGSAVANFNVNTGVVGTTGGTAFLDASMQNVGDGWYRCILKLTSHPSGTEFFTINLGDADTGTGVSYIYLGDGTSGLYVWGVQAELGAFPTSYIPTTTATVTRSADIVSSTDATLLAAQGWVVEVGELPGSTTATLLGINTAIGLGATSGNALTTADGGTQTTGNTGTWTSQNRGGIAWDSTPRVSIDLDGGTVVTAANTPAIPTALYFGNTNSGGSGFLNGHLRMMAAYAAVSDSQLATISAVGASFTIAGTDVNAALAANEASDTAAVVASIGDNAALAATEAADTAAIVASVGDNAALAATEAQDVALINTTESDVAVLAATESQDIAAIVVQVKDNAALAATEAQDVAAINASVGDNAALAATEAKDVALINASETDVVVLAATEAQDVAAFVVTETNNAALAVTEAKDTASINASGGVNASLAAIEAPDIAAMVVGITDAITFTATETPDTAAIIISNPAPFLAALAATELPDIAAIVASMEEISHIDPGLPTNRFIWPRTPERHLF